MASRAAHLNLIDVEARALIGVAYPLSWSSSQGCLEVLERVHLLSNRQTDPLLRARSRMSCYFYRIWATGWNPRDAEQCPNALNEIREAADPATLSYHLAEYSLIQWISSEYRAANRSLSEAVSTLVENFEENYVNLSLVTWVYQLFSSSSLLFLGEWGEALREFRTGNRNPGQEW
jgi:hypothetical protein